MSVRLTSSLSNRMVRSRLELQQLRFGNLLEPVGQRLGVFVNGVVELLFKLVAAVNPAECLRSP